MGESYKERQEEELQVLSAIYLDDFVDLRSAQLKKTHASPEICLKLTPLQSIVGKDVHAQIDLIVKYTTKYPNDPPVINLANAKGLSDDKVSLLKKQLTEMADNLLGEVMVLQLAQHTQMFLHSHNKPQLSFYDQMMSNRRLESERKRKEEESKKARHLAEVNEEEIDVMRQIEEEMLRREEMMKEVKKKRQRTVTVNSGSVPHEEISAKSCVREPSSQVRIVDFSVRDGERNIHIGKCSGHHFEGQCIRCAFDSDSGDVLSVVEWKFEANDTVKRSQKMSQDFTESLGKQIKNIEQELQYLVGKLEHPNLVQYLGHRKETSAEGINFMVLLDQLPFESLDQDLKGTGASFEVIRVYARQLVDVMTYLHNKSVVHRDLKLEHIFKGRQNSLKVNGYAALTRLADIKATHQQQSEGHSDDASSRKMLRGGKKGDVFNLGIALLSLVQGKLISDSAVQYPEGLPSEFQDFLNRCLDANERERWNFSQLLRHSFLLPPDPTSNVMEQKGKEAVVQRQEMADVENEAVLLMGDLVLTGKSRLKSEFEILQWLGQGGFGSVIKVRNKLDGKFYAIKKVALNPRNPQLNKRITREVKLLSRLNHEHVVRYYTAWIEREDVPPVTDSSSDASMSGASQRSKKPGSKVKEEMDSEKSLLAINKIEAPDYVAPDNEESESWYESRDNVGDDESSSSSGSLSDAVDSTLKRSGGLLRNVSKFESSDGVSFQVDDSVFQFGDLLDSEESDEEQMDTQTETSSVDNVVPLQYLYIQMEYYEKNTLRNIIDEGLCLDSDRKWRLFREIIEGLHHVHSQGIIHRDLKPVNIFMDSCDHVKIGDFGLATSHAPSKVELAEMNERDRSSDDKMTGKVGTALYVAPELGGAVSRIKFSQKVDIYSLGVIFFEMCMRPLTTGMERVMVIGALRKVDIVLPDNFQQTNSSREKFLLKWLLQHNPDSRPTAQELLDSGYVPPKLEDRHLDEILRHTLNQTNSSLYQRLMSSLFHQHVGPVVEQLYDTDMHGKQEMMVMNDIRALNYVEEVVRTTFEKYGAIKMSTPLLLPRGREFAGLESAVSVMDRHGVLLNLPYDSRINFARYIARNDITHVKRYLSGHVYRDPKLHRAHPREIRECSYDIVTESVTNCVPDAEVLFAVSELIKQFPVLEKRSYFVRLNHTSLLKAILMHMGLSDEYQCKVCDILHEVKGEQDKYSILTNFLMDVGFPEHALSKFFLFLEFEGTVSKAREVLQVLRKCKGMVGILAKQAFADIEQVIKHAKAFGMQIQVHVFPSLAYNISHFSGLIFQFVALNQRKSKRGGVDILAAGGRYDPLIEAFRLPGNRRSLPGAVGVSIAIEKIVSSCMESGDKRDILSLPYSECDVLVCAVGQVSSQATLIDIVRDLWKMNIRASLLYDSNEQDLSIEEIQEYCKAKGIQHLVIVKQEDSEPLKYRTREKDKFIEIKVPYQNLYHLIQQRLMGKTESRESDAVPIETITAPNAVVNDNVQPMVTFATQEKLPNNLKRKHESHMMSKLAPILKQLCVKTQVEVLVLDVPPYVLRNVVAYLELDGEVEDFETSIATLVEHTHKISKMYLQRISNTLWEIKRPKSYDRSDRNLVILYTYKGDYFRILL